MFTTITIEQTERGYRFTLPEFCAPSRDLVRALQGQTCIAYHAAELGGTPYRTFPADKLDYVKGFLAYWYTEQDPRGERGKNRNGGNCVAVVVEMPEAERMAA